MNIAIILIAGNSSRIHSTSTPKQFVLINDVPLFVHTVKTFNACYEIDEIVLVTRNDSIDFVNEQIKKYNLTKVSDVIEGGSTRQESVYNALICKNYSDNDVILIHDGARVLVSERIINDNINACKEFGAACTAIKVNDTLCYAEENIVKDYISRDGLFRAQTPQTFRYKIIKDAHEKNKGFNATDDSSLVRMYWPVHIVQGDLKNFKITFDEDIAFIKEILEK